MPAPCVLSLDNITVMPKSLLVERVTRPGIDRMAEAYTALRVATGC